MLSGVEKAFEKFAAGLKIPKERLKITLERSEYLSEWFKRKLKVTGTFHGGSYRRGTGMPLDSLKLHLIFSQKYYYEYKENSAKLLYFVKNQLLEDYNQALIIKGGLAVRIKVPTAVDLDLLPTIKLTQEGYLVPNGNGGWSKTNPAREKQIFKTKDENSSGKFLKLVKIIKAYNLKAGRPFNPYFLELVIFYRVNEFTKLCADLVHALFSSMRLFLPEFLNCPAAGEIISSGAPESVRRRLIDEAFALTSRAAGEREYEKSVLLWKSLLGDRFGK